MNSTDMTWTPATGLCSFVARERSCAAPIAAAHGTAPSFAGTSALAAAHGVRVTDLPGSPPRGAPV